MREYGLEDCRQRILVSRMRMGTSEGEVGSRYRQVGEVEESENYKRRQ